MAGKLQTKNQVSTSRGTKAIRSDWCGNHSSCVQDERRCWDAALVPCKMNEAAGMQPWCRGTVRLSVRMLLVGPVQPIGDRPYKFHGKPIKGT